MEQANYTPTAFGEARRTPGRHGYVAYFPAPIPRAIELPAQRCACSAEAEASLGRLDGIGRLLPDPTCSCGRTCCARRSPRRGSKARRRRSARSTSSTPAVTRPTPDVEEVLGYVDAMQWGLDQRDTLPLSTRLVREMHRRLLAGVRGRDRTPGELRTTQNWIGEPGSTIETARFVPPPPAELPALLTDWERFANEDAEMPLLVQNALLHAQFETHPPVPRRQRPRRAAAARVLPHRPRPAVGATAVPQRVSRARRAAVLRGATGRERGGDVAPWIDLFLTAVQTQADDAVARAQRIVELREALSAGGGNNQQRARAGARRPHLREPPGDQRGSSNGSSA